MKKPILLASSFFVLFPILVFGQGINTSDLRAYTGSLYIGAESLRQTAAFTEDQLLDRTGFTLGGGYGDYEIDEETDRRFEGDLEAITGSVAYVHAFEALKVGIVLSAANGELDSEGTDSNAVALESEGDGWLLSLGAAKSWDKLSLVLQGTIGELSLDSKRATAVPGIKEADYDLSLYQIELMAAYALVENKDFLIHPFTKLGYRGLENDAFVEESPAADRLEFDAFEDDQPYAEAGVSGMLMTLGDFVPRASLSVWQDLGDDETEFEGRDPVPNSFAFEAPDAVGTMVKGELGFGWTLDNDLSLDASAGYLIADELDGFNLAASLTYSF